MSEAATFDISCIVSASPRDLDDVLDEQDITEVEWIPKPVCEILEEPEEAELPGTDTALSDVLEAQAPPVPFDVVTLNTSPSRQGYVRLNAVPPTIAPNVRPSEFSELVEQVVRIARRVGHRYRNPEGQATQSGDSSQLLRYFDHMTTFGSRETDSSHNRKIGAVGEGYVGRPFCAAKLRLTLHPGLYPTLSPQPPQLQRSQLAEHDTKRTYRPFCFRRSGSMAWTRDF